MLTYYEEAMSGTYNVHVDLMLINKEDDMKCSPTIKRPCLARVMSTLIWC